MPFQVDFDEELGMVRVRLEGWVTPGELHAAARSAREAGETHKTRLCLADCSALRGGHTISSLVPLVESLAAERLQGCFRKALVAPSHPEARRDIAFWETACRNRGFEVRVFDRLEDALAWLVR